MYSRSTDRKKQEGGGGGRPKLPTVQRRKGGGRSEITDRSQEGGASKISLRNAAVISCANTRNTTKNITSPTVSRSPDVSSGLILCEETQYKTEHITVSNFAAQRFRRHRFLALSLLLAPTPSPAADKKRPTSQTSVERTWVSVSCTNRSATG